MKQCRRCKEQTDNFGRDKSKPDGLNIYCRRCINLGNINQRYNRREYSRRRIIERRQLPCRQCGGPPSFGKNGRKRPICDTCRETNAKAHSSYLTPTRKAQRNERDAVRRQVDPVFRLKRNMRRTIHRVLTTSKRGQRTFAILGYTADDLKRHLERQFLPGMSWLNYGEWEVEHILPVALFDLPAEVRECWALTNLRPWPALDNLKKGAQRLHLI